MTGRDSNKEYKSCFLNNANKDEPEVEVPLADPAVDANKDEPEVEVPLADPAVGMSEALPSVEIKEDELSEAPLADPAADKCYTVYPERCKKASSGDRKYLDLTEQ